MWQIMTRGTRTSGQFAVDDYRKQLPINAFGTRLPPLSQRRDVEGKTLPC